MEYNAYACALKKGYTLDRKALLGCALGLYFPIHFFSVFLRYDYLMLEALFLALFFCIGGKLKLKYVALLPLLVAIGIRYFAGHSSVTGYFAPVYHLVKYFRLLLIPILADISSRITPRQKNFLGWEVSVCILLTDIISLYYAHINPLAIRYRGLQDQIDYYGIIQFDQIFSFAIVEVFLFAVLLDSDIPLGKKLFPSLVFAVNSLMLIKAQLMTPIAVMLLIAALYLFFETGKFFKRFLLFPMALLFLAARKPILTFLIAQIEKMQSTIMSRRIEAILNALLENSGQANALSARLVKVRISLTSFLKSPYFGIGFTNFDGKTVGCHQDWFDILAVSGIFAFLFILIFLVLQFRDIMRRCEDKKGRHMCAAAFLAFLILGFLDPALSPTILIAVFVLAPNYQFLGGKYDKRIHLYRPYL